jgi:hypothetical protein
VSNEPKSEIAAISEEAWRATAKLAKSAGKYPPPVALDTIAQDLSIECIRFAPIVSDAGLAKVSEGFQIVINTEASSVSYPSGTRLLTNAGQWSRLPATLRFTVAHEIAHVIFLRAANSDQKRDLFQKNERAVEHCCSILARMLLLPSELLVRELAGGLFDPRVIADVCARCQVSPEVFIRRFHISDMGDQYRDANGFVAFVREAHAEASIKACHIFGVLARDRFHRALEKDGQAAKPRTKHRSLSDSYAQPKWAMEGRLLSDLQLSQQFELSLGNGFSGPIGFDADWGSGKVIPCSFSACRTNEPSGVLLCVKVLGPVQGRDERVLL